MIKNKGKLFALLLSVGLSFAYLAHAQIVNCGRTGQTACKITDLIFTIERIINFLLSWAWLVSVFFIMWAGYDMIFAGGNSEALQSAKSKLSHAIIGFILIMISYILVNWIVSIFSGTGTPGPGAFDFYKNFIQP